jgi:hypothetical protein
LRQDKYFQKVKSINRCSSDFAKSSFSACNIIENGLGPALVVNA